MPAAFCFAMLHLSACLCDSYFINRIHYSVKKQLPILFTFVKGEIKRQTAAEQLVNGRLLKTTLKSQFKNIK